MSSSMIHRAAPVDLEVRTGGDGRTVSGIAVPFDSPTEIDSYEGRFTESFQRGSFAKTILERGDRVKFLSQHDAHQNPLGRATLLREDSAGLYAEFRVSNTQAGNEALELIRDGVLDSLSIGFRVINDVWDRHRTTRTVTEAALREVSAVNFPAYAGATISGVRSGTTHSISPDQAARRLRLLDL